MGSRRRWIFPALLALLFLAAPAFAAGSEDVTESTIGWVFRWLNFALVFGGGGYLLAKYGRVYFRARAEKIAGAIAEATQARKDAEARLREIEAKLGRLDKEAEQFRAAARQAGAAEAERIRALARDEVRKIERAAQGETEAAERIARIELKAIAARLAVERAEAMLRERMTAQAQAGLFQFFVKSLARSVN